MRVRVIAPFIDAETGDLRQPGDVLEVTEARWERMRLRKVAEPATDKQERSDEPQKGRRRREG